jgi:hypothetical protein
MLFISDFFHFFKEKCFLKTNEELSNLLGIDFILKLKTTTYLVVVFSFVRFDIVFKNRF